MENHNNHYICTGGCGGVSDKPGVCQAPDCPRHGQSLTPCDCQDGQHEPVSRDDSDKKEADDNIQP